METTLVPDSRVEEADWFSDALAGFGGRVEQVLPRSFPAYARILHPADGGAVHSRWAEVAASVGTVVHPLAQFGALARRGSSSHRLSAAGWEGQNPFQGSLDIHELTILCGILAETTQPDERCWATVWEGWGNLPMDWKDRFPRIKQPHRAYFLFERRLDEIVSLAIELAAWRPEEPSRWSAYFVAIDESDDLAPDDPPTPTLPDVEVPVHVQSPSQWWSASRHWCVATEIDFDSTLVGGPHALIQRILDDSRLEAFPVAPSDDVGSGGDTVNELPGSG